MITQQEGISRMGSSAVKQEKQEYLLHWLSCVLSGTHTSTGLAHRRPSAGVSSPSRVLPQYGEVSLHAFPLPITRSHLCTFYISAYIKLGLTGRRNLFGSIKGFSRNLPTYIWTFCN